MESSPSDKNLLTNSSLPSIGCFILILSYMGSRKTIKRILKRLQKAGGLNYFMKHV